MPNNLKPGKCVVRSVMTGQPQLGVNHTKPGMQPVIVNGPSHEWLVSKADGGRFFLNVGGYHTGLFETAVYGTIHEADRREWIITHRKEQDAYTIEAKDGDGRGWTVPYDHVQPDRTPVTVAPIIATASLPPFFSPAQLFRFDYD
ncbi:hypothetical protein HYDPIDRAFT_30778 [Hydnomerulius pinastri MD-312]|uniref:Unplaced genomic scaffold scaffold_24, whole genome shotgun sequence n=1 Tax=Hydnomerulius pinastri MD-312 TaxID=994086 RepID=A0A0C9W5H9_9AGAM|nr:hypothetical protein HYDPIDRAFT_30778 [Hydnomerulius pinastri MD-312]